MLFHNLEVEDKIFGPITIRQFIILLVAGLTIFLAYRYGDFSLFVTILVFVGGSALTFAFVKVNGQAFHFFLLNIIQTLRRPSLRVWNKTFTKEELNYLRKQKIEEVEAPVESKTVKSRHIRDLALIVNTGGFYRPDQEINFYEK